MNRRERGGQDSEYVRGEVRRKNRGDGRSEEWIILVERGGEEGRGGQESKKGRACMRV